MDPYRLIAIIGSSSAKKGQIAGMMTMETQIGYYSLFSDGAATQPANANTPVVKTEQDRFTAVATDYRDNKTGMFAVETVAPIQQINLKQEIVKSQFKGNMAPVVKLQPEQRKPQISARNEFFDAPAAEFPVEPVAKPTPAPRVAANVHYLYPDRQYQKKIS